MLAAGVLVGCGLGCDAQVDALYRGEPIARLEGELHLEGTGLHLGPRSLELGLIWVTRRTAELMPLRANLDLDRGTFEALVYDPPQAESLLSCDLDVAGGAPASTLGFAWLAAARPGVFEPRRTSLASAIALRTSGDLLGWAEGSVLVEVRGEVTSDSDAARLLGAALPPGLHLRSGRRALEATSLDDPLAIPVQGPSKPSSTPFLPPERCGATEAQAPSEPDMSGASGGADSGDTTSPSSRDRSVSSGGAAPMAGTAGGMDPLGSDDEPGGLR